MEDSGLDGNNRQKSEFSTWKAKLALLATFAASAYLAISFARITRPWLNRFIRLIAGG